MIRIVFQHHKIKSIPTDNTWILNKFCGNFVWTDIFCNGEVKLTNFFFFLMKNLINGATIAGAVTISAIIPIKGPVPNPLSSSIVASFSKKKFPKKIPNFQKKIEKSFFNDSWIRDDGVRDESNNW